jgi:DNA-directed RNA polymerase beta' subunit
MKLIKQPAELEFDPSKIVSDDAIFSKKAKIEDDMLDGETEKEFSDTGLFSKRIFGDIENAEDDYSCDCGNLRGKFYDGTVCEKCGSAVKYRGANIDKVGWIDISGAVYDENGGMTVPGKGWKIIKYVAYGFLEKIIGKENLKNIIYVPNTITVEGSLDMDAIGEIQNTDAQHKYWYIGLTEFYSKYKEILDYYIDLRKFTNKAVIDFVSNPIDVFTDKIMVIPAVMRPAMRTADGLKLDAINNIYVAIIKYVNTLNSPSTTLDIVKNSMLEMIQAELFVLTQHVFDLVRGKEGLIRSQICGTRVNYSARAIITPASPDVPIDGVVLPYEMFLQLYRFEIINILRKIKGIGYKDAETIVFKGGIQYDDELYDIMEHIVKTNEIGILLNRNPTINVGSIHYLRVVDIKKPKDGDLMYDLTVSVNNLYLTPMAADYDGDTLNIVALKDEETRKVYKNVFSPISLLIDPKNGKFNNQYDLEKDQVLGINALLH